MNDIEDVVKKVFVVVLAVIVEFAISVLAYAVTFIFLSSQYSTDQDQNSEPSQIFESEVNDKLYDNSITY